MSRSLTPLVTNTVYQTWFTLTNSIVTMLANEVVTANSGGAMTVGNGFVTGVFGANTLVGTNLQGGNTSVSANLIVTSNVNFSVGSTINNINQLNINTTTTSTATQVVDSWLLGTYRSAEYTLTVKNSVANGYQMSKLLMLQDGGTSVSYVTEYGVISSNGNLGVFSASANSTQAILSFTPIPTATTIQGLRTATAI